jgi:hypothetical protein
MTWIHNETKSCPLAAPTQLRCLKSLPSSLHPVFLTPSLQKNGGCNHMKCGRCSLHFCWLCMSEISG